MPTRHEVLFAAYIDELAAAKDEAERWWATLLEAEQQRSGSREAALRSVRERWPIGPASHPRVLAVIRKYWIACAEINRQIELEEEDEEHHPARTFIRHEVVPEGTEAEPEREEAEPEVELPPPVFIFEQLAGRADALADFLSVLPYPPIGTTEEGAFV